jgi:hypothetical protein
MLVRSYVTLAIAVYLTSAFDGSIQVQVSAALLKVKEAPVFIGQEADWPQSRFESDGEEKNLLSEIKPLPSGLKPSYYSE